MFSEQEQVKSLTRRWIEAVGSWDVCRDGLFTCMYSMCVWACVYSVCVSGVCV